MNKATLHQIFSTNAGFGALALRVPVGIIFAAHGAQKLFGWFGGYGLEGTGGWMESIGLAPGVLMAFLAGAAEFFGGLALVYGNLLPYFIQTQYELYDTEIVIYYAFIKVSRPYSQFACFYRDKLGLMLSTFKVPRRLDPFRGQSLRFSKTQKEVPQLLNILREKIGKEY